MERIKIQFRAEAFNLTNTVAFGLPNTNVSGGSPRVIITSLAADPANPAVCAQTQLLKHGPERHPPEFPYDYLVLALGSMADFVGLPALEHRAMTIKSLRDAKTPLRARERLTRVTDSGGGNAFMSVLVLYDKR
jgi:hypothetical protein